MRILVVGAGGIGGYYGGRLLSAGRDVTFLVRQRRAAQLAEAGLVVRSQFGDLDLPSPPTVLAEDIQSPFDLILLSCKAYDLEAAMESLAPACGPDTLILPVLNGMRHMDLLKARFGENRVLGGLCLISVVLDPEGRVLHLNDLHGLTFGEPDGGLTPRIEAVASALTGAGFDARLSESILQDMWEKWVFLASLAASTSLMRTSVGNILAAPGGRDFLLGILDECSAIAADAGHMPGGPFFQRTRGLLTTEGSPMTASMFRDIKAGLPVEADHVIGDLIVRADAAKIPVPKLRTAYTHLKAYEKQRQA